tara:strand:- start:69 stop:497 length:429 start_codon:yes stop_codon:yes gene_type:complete
MALPNGSGGYQVGDGNTGEILFVAQPTPTSIAAGNAQLTAAQLATRILLGSPGSSAAAYTLPTAALTDAAFPSMPNNSSFDFTVINVDGSSSGVITMTTATGWTIGTSGSQGLMTVAATAGTSISFRARKTGDAAWSLYRIG